jgi:twitching motility protein PilT
MSKPIYEIPVTGEDEQTVSFPPPAPNATPASYSSAPPPLAGSAAPGPTVWPMAAPDASPVAASMPAPSFAAPTAASMPAPAMPAPAPSVPTQAWPAPAAAEYPAPDAAAFMAPPPAVSSPVTAPDPFLSNQSLPNPTWPAPGTESVHETPVTAAPSAVSDDLNFPPPRIGGAAAPSAHSADFPITAPRAAAKIELGEDMGFETADPDLTEALREVLMRTASDLHVTANMPPMLRVDGALQNGMFKEPWSTEKVRTALRSIMTPAQEEIFDRDLELDFAYTVSANARFRVNFYQQREAMGAAFRLIPTEIKQLEDLGVPDSVARFATLARGLVLVTGPTGSGKSTTLAALVDLVNRTRADHIMTVEDPIEFLHGNHKSLVNQREVGTDTHSFGAALKHVLRQDPDVILIGELRDLETISVALTAAETGHLVFATLHTQDAAQTIDRVIDVFPPHQQGQVRSQLAATLQGVVCQTLVKKANGRGRAVATEVLIATPAIGNLIREGKTYQISSAMQAGGELGMHTMDRHLADLANSGIITQKAAMEKAQDLEGLKQMIHRVETPADAATQAMQRSSIDFDNAYAGADN